VQPAELLNYIYMPPLDHDALCRIGCWAVCSDDMDPRWADGTRLAEHYIGNR
jgi:hypothetical protein